MAAWPVDPDALRALWRAGGDRPLAVAVSGGGDSLALLALLRLAEPTWPLLALIVDHAIQPGSAHIAAEAAHRAQALGAHPIIRRLTWPGAAAADQASARQGRYRALAEEAKAAGAAVIAIAHTRDDQAETALIKAARSGRWGEGGMRPWSALPVWPEGLGLWAPRPLLNVSRAALRAWATDAGLAWHEDPANANEAYARVRARAILSANPALTERLATHAARAACAVGRRNAAAQAWINTVANFDEPQGGVALARLPTDRAGLRGLSVLLGAVAGDPHAAPPDAVARLVQALKDGATAQTLGGAMVRRRVNAFVISRDPGALLGRSGVAPAAPQPLVAGAPLVVDARLWLRTEAAGYEVAVTPKAAWALRRHGHWIALNAADDVAVQWLTAAHVHHVLGRRDGEAAAPFASCDAGKGVQQALGLLS